MKDLIRTFYASTYHPLLMAFLMNPNMPTTNKSLQPALANMILIRITSSTTVITLALCNITKTTACAKTSPRPAPDLTSDPSDQAVQFSDTQAEAMRHRTKTTLLQLTHTIFISSLRLLRSTLKT